MHIEDHVRIFKYKSLATSCTRREPFNYYMVVDTKAKRALTLMNLSEKILVQSTTIEEAPQEANEVGWLDLLVITGVSRDLALEWLESKDDLWFLY